MTVTGPCGAMLGAHRYEPAFNSSIAPSIRGGGDWDQAGLATAAKKRAVVATACDRVISLLQIPLYKHECRIARIWACNEPHLPLHVDRGVAVA